ncbi:hypothetical protein K3495_g7516 [Podosphaera aphanis]|nr:hypothetical protein K3495_g7516 [Podosphaera aphanis]
MLETDALDGVIAGIISQLQANGEWHPVGYFSKTMSTTKLNYTYHDKEMLAIRPAGPLVRDIITILLYHYLPSWEKNDLADVLLRREQDLDPQAVVKANLRHKSFLNPDQIDPNIHNPTTCQFSLSQSIPLINNISEANKNDTSLKEKREIGLQNAKGYSLSNDLLFFNGLLFMHDVDTLRTNLIKEAHDPISSAHPSSAKLVRILRIKYYWHTLRSDCVRYIKNCAKCRESHRPNGKTPEILQSLPVPQYRWQHICVDFKSFPKDRTGFDSIAVFIGRFSKEALSLPCYKTTTSKELTELFYLHVCRYHNIPQSIVSDRGPQFVSSFWKSFCSLIGSTINLSTAYHSETDGQREIMNQHIDQRLRPCVNYYQDNWASMLSALDNAQLTLPHSSPGISHYELSYGGPLRKSFD